jgi:hypothetical protein
VITVKMRTQFVLVMSVVWRIVNTAVIITEDNKNPLVPTLLNGFDSSFE